jgi:hypothetical protein
LGNFPNCPNCTLSCLKGAKSSFCDFSLTQMLSCFSAMCFARSATTVGVQCSRTSPGSIFSSAEVGLSLLRPAPRLAGSEGARSTLWARSSAPGSSARRLPRVRQNAVLARVCLAPGCLGRRRRLPAWRTAAARSGLGCSVRLSALSGWSALSNCRLCPAVWCGCRHFWRGVVELRLGRSPFLSFPSLFLSFPVECALH